MAQVIDPVCDMTVDTETAEYQSSYQGATYYFCGAGCKRAFDKNPAEFVKQDPEDQSRSGQDGTHGDGYQA